LDTSFGAAVLKARKVITGNRAFYRQSVCFASFYRKPPSRLLVKPTGYQTSTPPSLFALFAFAVNSFRFVE
jgi:hypothetical protein